MYMLAYNWTLLLFEMYLENLYIKFCVPSLARWTFIWLYDFPASIFKSYELRNALKYSESVSFHSIEICTMFRNIFCFYYHFEWWFYWHFCVTKTSLFLRHWCLWMPCRLYGDNQLKCGKKLLKVLTPQIRWTKCYYLNKLN